METIHFIHLMRLIQSNPIGIAQCDMENAISESGTFNLLINDHNNEIGKDNIHNVKVFIELGKTNTSFQHFMIGYGDIFRVDRPHTNAQYYTLNGFGSLLWAYQLLIHRRETYKKGQVDGEIWKIIKNALTDKQWRPLKGNDRSIQTITGWSTAGISEEVNTFFSTIEKPFVYFGDLCDELCDVTGAVWFIDYSTGVEKFTLVYNPSLQVPVVIKSGDLADRINDNPNRTSYIKSAFQVEDNSSTQAGTATRLITVTTSDETIIYEQDEHTSNGFTTLNNRAVAQQIILDNDSRRIVSFEMRLEKFGEPESPNSRINGHIVKDNGANKPQHESRNR